MIAYLKGTVHRKETSRLILDVHDVGYEVEISTQTLEQIPAAGKEVTLLIHHHITDSDQRLFGFISSDEKALFELLITVKGVGPKLGLTILSGLPASEITRAILQSDRSALSRISGIGKKTAERMILELKDKISEFTGEEAVSGETAGLSGKRQEAVSALESLGFRKQDAEKAVSAAAKGEDDGSTVQDLVKKALAQSK